MKIDLTLPIATIAGEMPAARQIFESLGIDYACAGGRSIADAAREAGLDPELVIAALRRIWKASPGSSWNERPLTELTQHLTCEHHRVVREELKTIAYSMFDLCAPPATPSRDLQSLRAALVRLSEIILPHMGEEEEDLFAPIDALSASNRKLTTDAELRTRIRKIVAEHATIAAQLNSIRDLRLTLETGDELSAAARSTLNQVARLEANLHEYMFFENCILFPRAVALQEQTSAA